MDFYKSHTSKSVIAVEYVFFNHHHHSKVKVAFMREKRGLSKEGDKHAREHAEPLSPITLGAMGLVSKWNFAFVSGKPLMLLPVENP